MCWTIVIMLLNGCSLGSDFQLDTQDDISFTTSKVGRTDFDYTMYWFAPRPKGSAYRMHEFLVSVGIGETRSTLHNAPSKEVKLKLEDLAVFQLQQKLEQNNQCPNGHKIENTFWFNRSINLTGFCL